MPNHSRSSTTIAHIQKSVPDNIVTFLCGTYVTHKRSVFCYHHERASIQAQDCLQRSCKGRKQVCPPLCPGVGRQFASRLLCSARLAQHSDCLPAMSLPSTDWIFACICTACKHCQQPVLFVTSDGTFTFVGSSIGACIQVVVMSTISHTLSWDRLSRIIRSRAKKLCRVGQHTSGRLSFANSRTRSRELSSSLHSSHHLTSIALARLFVHRGGAPRTFSPQFVGKFIRERSNLLVATSIVGFLRLITNVELRRLWLFLPRLHRVSSRSRCQGQHARGHHCRDVSALLDIRTLVRTCQSFSPAIFEIPRIHTKRQVTPPSTHPATTPSRLHARAQSLGRSPGFGRKPPNSCCRSGMKSRLKLQELVSFRGTRNLCLS